MLGKLYPISPALFTFTLSSVGMLFGSITLKVLKRTGEIRSPNNSLSNLYELEFQFNDIVFSYNGVTEIFRTRTFYFSNCLIEHKTMVLASLLAEVSHDKAKWNEKVLASLCAFRYVFVFETAFFVSRQLSIEKYRVNVKEDHDARSCNAEMINYKSYETEVFFVPRESRPLICKFLSFALSGTRPPIIFFVHIYILLLSSCRALLSFV